VSYYLTERSGNQKTGPIAVTTSTAKNCPPACSLRGAGCYAENGKLGMFWRKVTVGAAVPHGYGTLRPQTFPEHVAALRDSRSTMVRLNQAGDLPGRGDRLHSAQCLRLAGAAAHDGRVAWTYTHYPPTDHNLETIRAMNDAGCTVNVSTNNTAEACEAGRHGLPVVAVVSQDFRSQRIGPTRFVVCPAQCGPITCKGCGNGSPLCARRDRDYVIAFRAHGTGAGRMRGIQ
jgi:hypothetical protein